MEEKGTNFPRLAISLIFITNILLIIKNFPGPGALVTCSAKDGDIKEKKKHLGETEEEGGGVR